MSAYDCAQLQYTMQHRTVLIISTLTTGSREVHRCKRLHTGGFSGTGVRVSVLWTLCISGLTMRGPECREARGERVRETDQYIMRAGRRRATPGVVDAVVSYCGCSATGYDVAERLIVDAR